MVRKLVTVRQLGAIHQVAGSNMAIAQVDGWACAVQKATFKPGDLVLYFEIDSYLPSADSRFAALKSTTTWKGIKGFHVKSVMVGKEISQGLTMPLDQFTEVTSIIETLAKDKGRELAIKEVMEMSFERLLNVHKWELSPDEATRTLGSPPAFFPKTDVERIQNCPNLFTAKYKNVLFQETTKMDGMAMTVYYVKKDSQWYKSLPKLPEEARADTPTGRIGVCSRKHDLPETVKDRCWQAALANSLPRKLATLNRNVAIQGELCGETISDNKEGFAKGEHEFFVYRMFDIDAQKFLPPNTTETQARALGLKHVPVHGYVKLHEIAKDRDDILKRAEGMGLNGKKREGLVYKNCDDGRSFKAISNSYLVKHGE